MALSTYEPVPAKVVEGLRRVPGDPRRQGHRTRLTGGGKLAQGAGGAPAPTGVRSAAGATRPTMEAYSGRDQELVLVGASGRVSLICRDESQPQMLSTTICSPPVRSQPSSA